MSQIEYLILRFILKIINSVDHDLNHDSLELELLNMQDHSC